METLKQAVQDGDNKGSEERARTLLDGGESPEKILKDALIPAMDEVGVLFQKGEYFIPEMLLAARAMKSALAVIKPVLVDTGIEPEGKVVIGSVKGDLHDIGKNLVAMALEGGGFEVIDLGTDVSEKRFVDAVVEHKPLAIGISAMLTATMDSMRTIVDAIEAAGLRDEVKIMVGGAPVNEEFTQKIKADFYGETPTDGKDYVKCLVAK